MTKNKKPKKTTYIISYTVTFDYEDDEQIVKEGEIEREYDENLDPKKAFEDEFTDTCEDKLVDLPENLEWECSTLDVIKITKK